VVTNRQLADSAVTWSTVSTGNARARYAPAIRPVN